MVLFFFRVKGRIMGSGLWMVWGMLTFRVGGGGVVGGGVVGGSVAGVAVIGGAVIDGGLVG